MTIKDDVKHYALDVGKLVKNTACLVVLCVLAFLAYQIMFVHFAPRPNWDHTELEIVGAVAIAVALVFDSSYVTWLAKTAGGVYRAFMDAKNAPQVVNPQTGEMVAPPAKRGTMLAAAMTTGMAKAVPPPDIQPPGNPDPPVEAKP